MQSQSRGRNVAGRFSCAGVVCGRGMPRYGNSTAAASVTQESRRASLARSLKSAHSRASSAIAKATSTITALKSNKLDEDEELESVGSSHWDTDLENEDDDAEEEGEDNGLEAERGKEAYLKVCERLAVIPVSRFGNEIGQEEIRINHRALKECGARAVTSLLLHDRATARLHMAGNELGARSGLYIGQMLRKNRALTELNLANNRIKREGIAALADALLENTMIRRLDLSANALGDKDAKVCGRDLTAATRIDIQLSRMGHV